jgi:hypothetical protein
MLTLKFTPSPNAKKGETQGEGYLTFSPETNCFSCEASSARCDMPTSFVYVKNTATNSEIKFKFTHFDKDCSGEDIYGANYVAIEGHKKPCSLLIIND